MSKVDFVIVSSDHGHPEVGDLGRKTTVQVLQLRCGAVRCDLELALMKLAPP